jgi:hypothetical protein
MFYFTVAYLTIFHMTKSIGGHAVNRAIQFREVSTQNE